MVRNLLLSCLALLALLVAGAGATWWLGGADAQRWVVRWALAAAFDRDVQIDGTLQVELGAEPLLQLTGLRIDAAPWAEGPTLLRIERAEVRLALRPLLGGVLVLPLVTLEGVTIDLETAADGRQSWQSERAPAAAAAPRSEGVALPLLESLALRRATITYRDQRDGRRSQIIIASLTDHVDPAGGGMRLAAEGEINGNAFQVRGTSGSLGMALAATDPYPLALDLQLPAITAKLEGSITDIARGTGLDLRLEAQSPSLQAAAAAWGLSLAVDAAVAAGARLTGDLGALVVTDLDAQLTNAGGDRLDLSGRLDDVWVGSGLDLRLTLRLDPKGELSEILPAGWRVVDQLGATARVTGSTAAPVLDELVADLRGPGKSSLTLAGQIRLALADANPGIDGFDLDATFYVRQPSVFAAQLGFDPAVLGALRGEAALTLTDRRLEATRVAIMADDFGALQVEARGALATVTADRGLELAPDLSFTAKMAASSPLLALIDTRIAELGPVTTTGRLVGDEHGYRLDGVALDLGAASGPTLSAEGGVGPLVAGDAGATELDLSVRFGWPSSRFLRPLVGPELPELGKAEGDFGLSGTIERLRIAAARLETRSPAGVVVTLTGGVTSIQTAPPLALEGAAFAVQARAPSTTAAVELFGHEVPDLGPVQISANLGQGKGSIALTAIRLTTGPASKPAIEITGTIGDLLGLQKLELLGEFEIPTHELLALADIQGKPHLGSLHGKVVLSDADGSMGVEHLEAEVKETDLLSLTMEGLIDDVANLDQVEFETSLAVPSIANLADVLDADARGLERLQFDGKLSGNGGRFDADGQAVLGETRLDGKLAGNLRGARPSFKGRLHSAKLRLADLGLTPEAFDDASTTVAKAPPGQLFPSDPLPLESLQEFDLDLDIQIDGLEGIALAIDRATAQVSLADGALHLSSLRFGFVGGHAAANADVDTHEPVPTWRVHVEGDDVELGQLWRQLNTEVPLSGELDLVLDLEATGRSPRDLANSLAGDLSFALERGQLHSRLFGLTTASPVRWLTASSTRRGYANVDCLVARFQARDGIAAANTLVLATPDVIATGRGNIDFAQETLDLRINPAARHQRLANLTTPFTITGNLASPTVQVAAGGAAARMIGEIALAPVNLLGSLLSFVNDGGKDQDNPCLTLTGAASQP